MVSEDLIFESPFLGAVLFGLEDAADFFNMFDVPFAGVCLLYLCPVFGMIAAFLYKNWRCAE
jgi:hypothetical protein